MIAQGKFGIRHWFLAVAALFVSACFPTSDEPVLSADADADIALAGHWRGELDDEILYLHFLLEDGAAEGDRARGDDDRHYSILAVGGAVDDNGWLHLNAFAEAYEDGGMLSMVVLSEDGQSADDDDAGYIPMRYDFNDQGILILRFLNDDAIEAAIANGDIAGVLPEGMFDSARLTASAQDLAAFFSADGAASYFEDDALELERMGADE